MAEVTALDVAAAEPEAASRPTGDTRLPSLTGLRFLAALLVFGFHAYGARLLDTGAPGGPLDWVFGPGSAGVTFFFVLSGFVLCWSARSGDTAPRFWRRRLARIYPSHFVVLLGLLVLFALSGKAIVAGELIPQLLLVQSWSTQEHVYFGINTVSWSLAVEAFFYLLFPWLYRGVRAVPERLLWAATAAAVGLTWLIPLAVQALPEPHHYWAIWVFPLARTPEFLTGMLLAAVVRAGRWPVRAVTPVCVLTGVAYAASWALPMEVAHVAFPALFFAILIATAGAADAAGERTVWASRWAVWLGEVSFAFYLVHFTVIRLVVRTTGAERPLWAEIGVVLACLGLSVLLSWLLHRWVEVPGMRFFGAPRRRAALART